MWCQMITLRDRFFYPLTQMIDYYYLYNQNLMSTHNIHFHEEIGITNSNYSSSYIKVHTGKFE